MSPLTKKLMDRVASWPDEDVAELDELAREIEARRTGVYVINDAEWADLQESLREADRGEFVSDEIVEQANKRHGI
jgi:predicted transcriptional regulator